MPAAVRPVYTVRRVSTISPSNALYVVVSSGVFIFARAQQPWTLDGARIDWHCHRSCR